jgi:hypothetical protein
MLNHEGLTMSMTAEPLGTLPGKRRLALRSNCLYFAYISDLTTGATWSRILAARLVERGRVKVEALTERGGESNELWLWIGGWLV